MSTVGERDRQRGSEVRSRPRDEPSASQRARQNARTARRDAGRPRRSEDAETVDEALEIEREAGQREGARSRSQRPIVTTGDFGAAAPDPQRYEPGGALASGTVSIGAPMLFETVLIAVDEITNQHRFPLPSRLLIAWGAFGVLGMAKGNAARAASALAWGLVVATFYSAVAPSRPPAGLAALQTVGDFISGKYGVAGDATVTGTAAVGSRPSSAVSPSEVFSVGNGARVQ